MQTRKDLYQAHRLMTRRVTLALLQGQPGAAESPLRRIGVGTICGLMVVVLVGAGFGIAGFLFKGGARNLEEPGVLIIEEETGATYAYSPETKKLIPFLNYTSARLAMPTTSIQRKSVSSKSLAKYGRGPLTGIPGAPESLPHPDRPVKAPWALCVRGSEVTLLGGQKVGGRPLQDHQGVLVSGGDQVWLIWRDTRMKVSTRAARILAVGTPVPVDMRWLNGLPQGPDFVAPEIPGRGREVTGPDGPPAQVGQVYRVAAVAGTPERWYIQLPDGLSSVSRTQARLLLGSAPGPPREIPPSAATARPSKTSLYNRDLPETPPRIVAYERGPLCAVYRETGGLSTEARFTIGASVPHPPTPGGGLDQVILPGGGAFVGTLTAGGQRPQTYSILTDQGIRYPVATREDAAKLGYSTGAAAPVPANLLTLFRTGPILNTDAALRPFPAN